MSDNDPFSAFEQDRTIIKPSAGRAARAGAAAPAAPAAAAKSGDALTPFDLPGSAGFGPLLQAAAPLLSAAARLRSLAQHPNPPALRAALIEGVRGFESSARSRGLPNEQVVAARYMLCTFIDECASSTPWGGTGVWSSNSLLVQFHNESWGGEKVFTLLAKLSENVGLHRPLLELMHVMLSLGFEGRFRVLENGRNQLESLRERLAQLLRQQAGPLNPDLSPQWQGVAVPEPPLADGLPLWALAAIGSLLLLLLFAGLRLTLQGRSDAAFQSLQALDVRAAEVAPPAPPPSRTPRLAGLLKPEIAAGTVQVVDLADRSIITIAGDGFFEPGSAEVSANVRPLLTRIAEALNQLPGAVVITGHTDSQPIRSLRYPSNWHLSQERANAVRVLLMSTVKPDRVKAEGKADSKPVADNATTTGRSRNRRVEISLAAGS